MSNKNKLTSLSFMSSLQTRNNIKKKLPQAFQKPFNASRGESLPTSFYVEKLNSKSVDDRNANDKRNRKRSP